MNRRETIVLGKARPLSLEETPSQLLSKITRVLDWLLESLDFFVLILFSVGVRWEEGI